jgi:hypothetical protein
MKQTQGFAGAPAYGGFRQKNNLVENIANFKIWLN